jgi:exopolyphosphatase/guanosine-5'-triphosphate,3'-diphosphate pyrophosphatase
VRRVLTQQGLRQLVSFISRMSREDIAELEGVSPSRAGQLAAGALVAEAAMRALKLDMVEICPWALREGVILRRLDTLDGSAQADRSAHDLPGTLGRLTPFEARCTG